MELAEVVLDPRRTQGLMTPAMLRAAGVGRSVLSRARAAGEVTRVQPGVYARAPLEPLPRFVVTDKGIAPAYVAQVRAVLLSLGAGATACGRTAAALHGWGLLVEPSRTIEIAVGHGRGRARATRTRITQRRRLRRTQVEVLAGTQPLWLTTAVQTVIDCALTLTVIEAVVICDSALRAGDVTIAELLEAVRRQPGVREASRARRVVRMADPASGSVLESALRCRFILGGITGYTTQQVLRSDVGGHVLRTDFCFEGCRLVVETDGAKWHPDPVRDRQLDNRLVCLGYRVLRYTWADVVREADRVVGEVRQAIAAGRPDIHVVTEVAARVA